MVITACGIQTIYFTSLTNVKYSTNFLGFMQFLKFTSFEFDSLPNFFTEVLINQGNRTELLIRDDEMNYYQIANMIEFNPLKLFILFIFNIIGLVALSLLICIKKPSLKLKITKFIEFMTFKAFLVMYMVMFSPFGFSCFAEVENIERTSPFKIVSVSATFLFIMIMFLFIISLSKIACASPILTDRKVQKRFNMLQIGIKRHRRSLLFFPIIFGKMIVVMITTVLLKSDEIALGSILMVIHMITGALFVYASPFQRKSSNFLAVGSETILMLYFAMYCAFDTQNAAGMSNLGWILIFLTLTFA